MHLICKGVEAGEGCLTVDMSWHVPSSFPPFCPLSADDSGVSSFLPSFAPSLFSLASFFSLSFHLLLHHKVFKSFLSQCDSITTLIMSAHYL